MSARPLALGLTSAMCVSLAMTLAAPTAQAATPVTLHVSATGNDAGTCTTAPGCRTIQRAVNVAATFLPTPIDATILVGPGTFAESSADTSAGLTITSSAFSALTIVGSGADVTTISPAQPRRVIRIAGAYPVTISGVTITGGKAPAATAKAPAGDGGGILRTGGGDLTLDGVVLTKNAAGPGLAGTAGADRGTGSPDGADGGSSAAGGPGGSGGGVAMAGGVLTVVNSTIERNAAGAGGAGGKGGNGGDGRSGGLLSSAGAGGDGAAGSAGGVGGSGGGIAFAGSVLTIANSTIVTNASGRGGAGGAGGSGGAGSGSKAGGNAARGGSGGAGGQGGGIALLSGVTGATLTHVTLAANATDTGGPAGANGTPGTGKTNDSLVGASPTSGGQFLSGGLAAAAGTVTLEASLLANSQANCVPAATTATASVASDTSCFADGSGPAEAPNKVSASAGALSALAANGARTPTAAVASTNPAYGAVPVSSGLCGGTTSGKDQRGQTRPGLSGPTTCTAGAYEPQVPPVAPTITGKIASAAGKTKYGWYRDTVTVAFTCTAGSSSLTAPCPKPMVLSSSGANRGGTVTITNQQGLSASIKIALNIDKNKPTIAIKGVQKGKTYNAPRQVRCVAGDTLSGPYMCQVTATAKLIKGNRAVRIDYTATALDRAGNVRTKKGYYLYNR